jgi:uncharacterized protein YndB with AHSA1/START domain
MSATTNAQSVIDEGRYTVRRTIRIEAPVAMVWRAVTEPEHISRWFGQASFEGSGPGALGTLSFEGYGAVPVRVESIDPPVSVVYRWNNDDAGGSLPEAVDDATSTVFAFTLAAVDGATELTVVETGFDVTSDPAGNLDAHRRGWNDELDKLVALLEGAA